MINSANKVGEGIVRATPGKAGLPPWIIRVHEAGDGSGGAAGKVALPPWIIRVHEVGEGEARASPGKGGVPP